MTARVAVLATAFGFGPAAKAWSVGRALTAGHGVDVRYFGSGCALDFFAAQGLCPDGPAGPVPEHDPEFPAGYDAVVNVLAPELIPSPEVAALTHYVDSLGFLWQPADVPPDSPLRRVRAYYAQDLFGSAENLARLGMPDVTPVSGIVAETGVPPARPGRDGSRAVVHLGGLGNPAGTGSARAYLPLVERLLVELREGPHALTVAMNRAIDGLSLTTDVPVEHLSGADFRTAVADCAVVFSSPGLTTLVETSQAGRAYVPLPPQNWSQVVISERMAARSGLEIWPFLSARYRRIDERADEMGKAAEVREINRDLAADPDFAAEYGVLALRAAEAAEAPAVGAPFTGAREIAAAVAADLGARDDLLRG
ncbi:hypothetical protein EDD29_4301 [Actinocorallia herbida]|uniref:Uncharacterized protein n=1 Tax=Actinocorallia herbida TaxID=58109 RepID=A0A3N1CZK1_9ACTN|nr:hypothetical protein [Actinocorallia herbida]ROO86723.1 hypothetical protein EDD29_4301 [Actinocorallia herbida]